jgi:putative transposase
VHGKWDRARLLWPPTVWLYHRFSLRHRDGEELLAERRIQVSCEAIRLWCRRFGPLPASELRWRHPRRGDKWYLDEVALTINKHRYWLWRAVDQIELCSTSWFRVDVTSTPQSADYRRHKRLNNRAENSLRPVREHERAMQGRFKSPEQARAGVSPG